MKLGDKITKRTVWTEFAEGCHPHGGCNLTNHESVTGTVVYIHPRGRFYTLEFKFPRGSFMESFS